MHETQYDLFINSQLEFIGNRYEVREEIEDRLEKLVGFYVPLQECTEDGYYKLYIHTDAEEELTEAQLATLKNDFKLYLDDDEDEQHLTIQALLSITEIEVW